MPPVSALHSQRRSPFSPHSEDACNSNKPMSLQKWQQIGALIKTRVNYQPDRKGHGWTCVNHKKQT